MTVQSSTTNCDRPSSFSQSTERLSDLITSLFAAAENDIDLTVTSLRQHFAEIQDQSLLGWSLRVSHDGLQVEPSPIELWMHARDWSAPGYYLDFAEGDTFGWLEAVVVEHRSSLGRLLVFYTMLQNGYEQIHRSTGFQDAIERKIEITKRRVLAPDDTIPW